MSGSSNVGPVLGSLADVAVFLLWNVAVGLSIFLLPPAAALPITLLLTVGIVELYLLRAPFRGSSGIPALGPLRAPAGSLLLLVGTFLAMVWGVSELYVALVPVPEEQLNPFEFLLRSPGGRLTLAVLAVGIAPLVEELFFRGLIQGRLTRRYGAVVGIGAAAFLFAAVHALPWVFPLHFGLGVAFGIAVHLTGTVWAGVLLHAANNVMAVLGLTAVEGPPGAPPTPDTVADPAVAMAAVVGLVGLVGFVVALRRTGRTDRCEVGEQEGSP